MKHIVYFLLSLLATTAAQGSDERLYQHLSDLDLLSGQFESRRSPTGIDFESKEKLAAGGRSHARFHIEVEGALPVAGVDSLEGAIERVAAFLEAEVDQNHHEENPLYPGLGVDVVDLNGVNVAFFQYKNAREPDTFCRRALIYADGHVYIATMTLHSVTESDQMGMFLYALVIAMINSKEIDGLRGGHAT